LFFQRWYLSTSAASSAGSLESMKTAKTPALTGPISLAATTLTDAQLAYLVAYLATL
jgi:hypothetical protein